MKNQEKLVKQLTEKGYKISFAESCTGGLAAASLVGVSGASAVFDLSFVTYANSAKEAVLGVSRQLLEAYGAVSEEVALAMASGASRVSGAEIAVGISGIAGPLGGSPEKPVGTVCFGFYINGMTESITGHFENMDRSAVRSSAVDFVFEYLTKKLS